MHPLWTTIHSLCNGITPAFFRDFPVNNGNILPNNGQATASFYPKSACGPRCGAKNQEDSTGKHQESAGNNIFHMDLGSKRCHKHPFLSRKDGEMKRFMPGKIAWRPGKMQKRTGKKRKERERWVF
jgi:hypothetical protein